MYRCQQFIIELSKAGETGFSPFKNFLHFYFVSSHMSDYNVFPKIYYSY